MTAPFPYDGVAGAQNDPAEAEAANLHANYKWVARLADEMNTEAQLDLKRVMQIVLHCRKFRVWYGALQARGKAAEGVIEGFFALKNCRWEKPEEMVSDLAAIYADCGTIADWIEANATDYKTGYTKGVVIAMSADGTPTISDEAIKAEKPVALAGLLTTLRSRFGDKPA